MKNKNLQSWLVITLIFWVLFHIGFVLDSIFGPNLFVQLIMLIAATVNIFYDKSKKKTMNFVS